MKATCHSTFGFSLSENFLETVEIWIDKQKDADSFADKKIFVCIEPNEISGINNYLKHNYKDFDFILAYDQEILNSVPNSILFQYGTTWIGEDFVSNTKEEHLGTFEPPKNRPRKQKSAAFGDANPMWLRR